MIPPKIKGECVPAKKRYERPLLSLSSTVQFQKLYRKFVKCPHKTPYMAMKLTSLSENYHSKACAQQEGTSRTSAKMNLKCFPASPIS